MTHASLNRSFRLVRRADAQVVPVPETARGHGAGRAVKAVSAAVLAITLAPFATAAPPPGATQLPAGGTLAAGQATWQSQGATLTVNQSSQRAVIDWQSFNLGSQATVIFNQSAGRAGATLNRVLDSAPSQIFGRIQAPGQVFISNPSGVIFGSTARVDVGGLVATSMTMNPADFMAGGTQWQRNGATGAVVNAGALTAADGGYVALLAPEVRNEGVIVARAGTVALAAGEAIRLEFAGTGLSGVQVTPAQLKTLVENRQAILAPGGVVILSARSADALRSGVVNQAGVIDAGSLVSRGGRVLLEGDTITLAAGSRTDAAGATGGGSVLVGGDWQGSGGMHQATSVTMQAGANIDVSATTQGDGGKAVLWSDTARADSSTRVQGTIAARGGAQGGDGGRIETSGHQVATAGSKVNASAAKGKGGLWLIDPTDIVIGSQEAYNYATTLEGGTDVLVQTAAIGGGAGDITLASEMFWSNNVSSTLTLSAAHNIYINAPLSMVTSNGHLVFQYGQGAVAAGNTSGYYINAPVMLPSGQHFATKLGSDGATVAYTVINALGAAGDTSGTTLQGISGNLAGHYVLGSTVDASATAGWNAGAGFAPLGDAGTLFSGTLDGLGHFITDLTINRPGAQYVGLFGNVDTGAVIANVGLPRASITGGSQVGALAGRNTGTVAGVFSTGQVTAASDIAGGLVGNAIGGSITDSYSTADVASAGNYAGGLAANNGSAISNTYATGNVTGANYVGGLIGYQNANPGSSLTNSYTPGTLTGYRDNGVTVVSSSGGVDVNSTATFAGWGLTTRWNQYDGHTAPLLSAFMRPVLVGAPNSMTYSGNLNIDPAVVAANTNDPAAAAALGGTLRYSGSAAPAAGTYASGVTLTGLYSDQMGSRIVFGHPGTLTIDPALLTVTGGVAASKVYNGTTAATVTGASISGVIGSDNVSLVAAGLFADKNVGTAKPVTTVYTLSGSAAGNYTVAQATGLSADITPAALTVTGNLSASKVYDGTVLATVTGATLSGVVAGDSLGLVSSATFGDKNVGTAKPVTTAFTLSGGAAGNYTLAQPGGLSADITPAVLTVAGGLASSKVYDGSTAATVTGATLSGVVAGDSLGLVSSATFGDKNVGTAKPVTTAFTLSGGAAGNYTLAQPGGLSADITPAVLTVAGGSASSKVYDGSAAATVTGASISGVIAGDSVGLVSSATFADRNVGTGKAVTATFAINGGDAGNYTFVQPAQPLTANITQLGSVAWVGGASGDWFAAGNWAGGAVPTLANVANVTIPSGSVVSLVNSNIGNAPVLTSLTGAGGVQLSQASLGTTGAVALDSVNIGSGATLAAGSLSTTHYTQSGGSLAVANALTVNGSFVQTDGLIRVGGAATVTQAAGNLGVQHLVSNGLNLSAVQGDLGFANLGSVGDVSLTASGSVTQVAGGSLTVLGKADVVAGGNVAIDQARNMVVGNIAVQGRDVHLTQGLDDMVLGNVSAAGSLTLNALRGNVRQGDATTVTVVGTTAVTAPLGSIYLMNADNRLGGAVSASASDIGITQGAAPLVLGDITASANLAIASGGSVTQAGTLVVHGKTSVDARANSVVLNNAANDFTGAVSVKSGALTLLDGVGGLSLGSVQTAGETLVNSTDGAIVQNSGAFTTTSPTTASFNARKDGAYTSVELNTSASVLVNGQSPGSSTGASVSGGVAAALSGLASRSVDGAAADVTKARRAKRVLAIPSMAPVKGE